MAVRTGMQDLVDRTRALANAGTAQYTSGTITYWSDQHIQDVLDRFYTRIIDASLTFQAENLNGTVNYLIAITGWQNLESGTARFVIKDGTFNTVGTANYSADYNAGVITFSSNQSGSALYLNAYSYDIYAAAVEILEGKLAYFDLWYDWSGGGQSFKRSQAIANIRSLIAVYGKKIGSNDPTHSGEVASSFFFRTDVTP